MGQIWWSVEYMGKKKHVHNSSYFLHFSESDCFCGGKKKQTDIDIDRKTDWK